MSNFFLNCLLTIALRARLTEPKKKKNHYKHLNSAMKIQTINCMYKEQENGKKKKYKPNYKMSAI